MSKGKATKLKRFARKITTENLEAKFDAGEDVSDYFDFTKATRPERLTKKLQVICDENQIEFRKLATGKWNILIHEPLASRVRQHCKRRKISTRQFVLGLFSQDATRQERV